MTDRASAPALVVVDVQQGMEDPVWGRRDNPDCEGNIAALLERWRDRGWPVVFVRHDSDRPDSPLAAGNPGNAFKDVVAGSPDLLVTKSVNSAFHGEPSLQGWLDGEGVRSIFICGITTNHCCETTARVGGNLGYDVRFVLDATHTFDRADPSGVVVPAEQLARVTATNLHGEFATVIDTATALAQPARTNREIVVAGFEAFQRGDLEAAFADMHPDFVYDNRTDAPGPAGTWHGLDGFLAMLSKVTEAFSEYSVELKESRDVGDEVELVFSERGRGAASGITFERRVISRYRFADGQVVRIESVLDPGR